MSYPKYCGRCGDKLILDHPNSQDLCTILCEKCGTEHGSIPLSDYQAVNDYTEDHEDHPPVKLDAGPPPTPLDTLGRISAHCLEMESDIMEINFMGVDDEYEDEVDDLKTDIQNLTFKVQELLDKWDTE